MRPIFLGPGCAIGLCLSTMACSPPPAAPSRRDPPFQATASIRDLMEAEIDPSADFLWASVASVSSEAGFEDRQPRTDERWSEVRRKALILIEATNLLVIPDRRVAANYVAARSAGELDSTESQKRVDASRDAFDAMAHVLRDAGLQALRAIDAKNPADLLEAGGVIDAACEACHVTYWYPDQAVSRQASR